MTQNIVVGIIAVIVIGAGIWAWRFENANTRKTISEEEEIAQGKEADKEN